MPSPACAVVDGAISGPAKENWVLMLLHQTLAERAIVVIVRFRAPFQILDMVVRGVFVFVVDLRQAFWIRYECQRDKSVDGYTFLDSR